METDPDARPLSTNPSASSPDSPASDRGERTTPVERLFARFAAIYGAKFSRLWAGADPSEIKAAWTEQLRRFPVEQITRAVNLCATEIEQPPTLPEFVKMVRSAYRKEDGHDPPTAISYARTVYDTAPDPIELQIRREYPKEDHPPYRYWAKQIMRASSLGKAMPFDSIKAARDVLHVQTTDEFLATYPPRL